MKRLAAWNEIVAAGALLGAAGLTPGTTGNVSVRAGDDGFVTSGTGTRLGALHDDDWALVGLDGAARDGIKPTKEAELHRAVYAARPDAGAIVHLHSPAALAVSCVDSLDTAEPLPAYTPYFAMRVRGLRLVDYFAPGAVDLAAAVAGAMADVDAVLLSRHGLVTVGVDLKAAVAAAEELETNCDLHLRLGGWSATGLPADEVRGLRG